MQLTYHDKIFLIYKTKIIYIKINHLLFFPDCKYFRNPGKISGLFDQCQKSLISGFYGKYRWNSIPRYCFRTPGRNHCFQYQSFENHLNNHSLKNQFFWLLPVILFGEASSSLLKSCANFSKKHYPIKMINF